MNPIIVGILIMVGTAQRTVEVPGWSSFTTVAECQAAGAPVVAGLEKAHPDKRVTLTCVDVTPK